MLYQLYESSALLSPFAEFASASSKLYNHPLSPFAHTPIAQRVSAGLDLMHRLAKDYEKPEFDITLGQRRRHRRRGAASRSRSRSRSAGCCASSASPTTCRCCRRLKEQPTVLVVAPLSGHHSTLLRETVRELLQGPQGLHHRLDRRAHGAASKPARSTSTTTSPTCRSSSATSAPTCNVISVCQPTVPVLAAVSLMASAGEPTPRTMTMMGGPIDARKSPTAVNNLAMNKSLRLVREQRDLPRAGRTIPGAGRRVYPGFLQHTGFVAMNPDRHLKSHYDYFLDLVRGDDDKRRLPPRVLRRVQRRARHAGRVLPRHDQDRVPGLRARQRHLGRRTASWCARRTSRPRALLTIEGELDDISGAGQTRAAHELCTGVPPSAPASTTTSIGAGHYGIFSGRRWREKVYPEVRDFIASAPGAPPTARAKPPQRRRQARAHEDGAQRRQRRERRDAAAPSHARWPTRCDDALPQTQCTRCGYPDCRGYAEAIAAGEADINQLPARRRRRHRAAGARSPAGPPCRSTRARRRRRRARLAVIDEAWCIGCTLCLKACPVDCHRRRRQAHAHRDRRAVHRLRAVHAGLPGRLHRAGRRDAATGTGWEAWSDGAGRQARERYAAHAARVGARAPMRDDAGGRAGQPAERDASPPRSHALAKRAARALTRRARRAPSDEPMKTADIEPFFATLRDANPQPATELEYASVFELLAAVLLSAQATDAASTRPRAGCSRVAPTPQKMLALGAAGARATRSARSACSAPRRRTCIATCRILVERARRPGAARRARRSRRCPASAARPPTWCSTSPSASRRMAVDTHVFRVANRTGLAPGKHAARGRAAPARARARRVPAERAPLADPARPLRLPGASGRCASVCAVARWCDSAPPALKRAPPAAS